MLVVGLICAVATHATTTLSTNPAENSRGDSAPHAGMTEQVGSIYGSRSRLCFKNQAQEARDRQLALEGPLTRSSGRLRQELFDRTNRRTISPRSNLSRQVCTFELTIQAPAM